jgi:hypothetical protein
MPMQGIDLMISWYARKSGNAGILAGFCARSAARDGGFASSSHVPALLEAKGAPRCAVHEGVNCPGKSALLGEKMTKPIISIIG